MKKKSKVSKKKELAVIPQNKEVVEQKAPVFSKEKIDLIRNTVARGATIEELKLFLYVAGKTGLDPLTRQIHFVKRGYGEKAQMTIQTGIDGYRAIAERTKTLAGIEDAIFDREDAAHPNKATVTVYRIIAGTRVPFTATARWTEYKPDKGGFMWDKMPYLMLAKCAEALALRKAFPNDLSGIYTNEEMAQADNKTLQTISPQNPAALATEENIKTINAETGATAENEFDNGTKSELPDIQMEEKFVPPVLCEGGCETELSPEVEEYSMKHYGKKLCRDCQKKNQRIS